jgi:hypothetical protein
MLRSIALVGGARTNEVLDHRSQVGRVEIVAEAVKRALDPFMAIVVNSGKELLESGAPGGM